jgi:hypothetical protein
MFNDIVLFDYIISTAGIEPIADSLTISESVTTSVVPTRYTDTNTDSSTTISDQVTVLTVPNRYLNSLYEILTTTYAADIPGSYLKTITDSTSTIEFIRSDYGKTVPDSATVSETSFADVTKIIKDLAWASSGVSATWTGLRTVAESIRISESFWVSFMEALAESGTVSDTTARGLGLGLRDSATLSISTSAKWSGTRTLAEVLMVVPAAVLVRTLPLLLAETGTNSDTIDYELAVMVREYVSGHETVTPKGTFKRTLSELLTAIETLTSGRGYLKTLSDSVTASEILSVILYLFLTRSETVNASETCTPLKKSYPVNSDSITISNVLTTKGTFKNTLVEALTAITMITLNGEVYQCWSFNDNEMYASLYTNYGFNSYATLGGHDYGCKSTGIYILEGATDAGVKIETGVRLNYAYLGTHLNKRMTHAFFGLVGDQPILKVILDNDEDNAVQYYVIDGVASMSRAAEGKKWELVLTDIDELQFIEITPVFLTR